MPRQPTVTALYDGHCAFCRACCRCLRALDWRGRIDFIDMHSRDTPPDPALLGAMQAHADGETLAGFHAVRRLLRELPLTMPLWLLLRLPGADWLGERVYRFIARNRYRIGGACECGVCAIDTPPQSRDSS